MRRLLCPPAVNLSLVVLLACAGLLASPASGQQKNRSTSGKTDLATAVASRTEFTGPQFRPEITVPRTTDAVVVDGVLDDAVWQHAAAATGFSENFPVEHAEPPIGITALMAYDDEHLYVAYVIEDDPVHIRANFSERDQIWQDDYSGFILDTNGDGQTQYFVAANPLGIQGDTRMGPNGEDVSFDLIFHSAGRVTESGYQLEFAIPFKSLRFPESEEQVWRMTHWITHPRESRNTYSWAATDRSDPCNACLLGYVHGLRGISPGRNIEVLPALTGSQSASSPVGGGGLDQGRLLMEPSLNMKFGLASNVTVDATVNPDFSQIESDAAQIDVNSTFALSYPERRAFFQEGADLFETPIDAVYTRSINSPIAAAKVSGRVGDWTVGTITARDETSPVLIPLAESSRLVSGGRSLSNILRARRSFEDGSFVAALATDRRLDDGGAGSLVGLDGMIRFRTNYRLEGQAIVSRTEEARLAAGEPGSVGSGGFDGHFADGRHTVALDGESFTGHAFMGRIARNARHYNFRVEYGESSPTFRTDNGFETSNDRRRINAHHSYTLFPENNPVMDRVNGWMGVQRSWFFDGDLREEWMSIGTNLTFKRQTSLTLEFFRSTEQFRGQKFTGMNRGWFFVNSTPSRRIQLNGNVSFGEGIHRSATPEPGRDVGINMNATVRLAGRMRVSPSINYSRMTAADDGETLFSGYIFRTRVSYQATRALSARLVTQYNDFAGALLLDPLITYRVNPFTVMHFGSTHTLQDHLVDGSGATAPRFEFGQTSRQIFFKLQYLLRT